MQTITFHCSNPDCSHTETVGWWPATRIDPGCVTEDPPDTCSECGAVMGLQGFVDSDEAPQIYDTVEERDRDLEW